jgi:hypothetical protein
MSAVILTGRQTDGLAAHDANPAAGLFGASADRPNWPWPIEQVSLSFAPFKLQKQNAFAKVAQMVECQPPIVCARRKILLAIAACTMGFSLFVGSVRAATDVPQDIQLETREFAVSVDGKQRGAVTMQIRRRSDGSESMHSDATIKILNLIIYKYTYTSAGTEVWKNGQLIALESAADFNGTRYAVKAAADANVLQLSVDGEPSRIPTDAWVTSYWQIPERLASAPAFGRPVFLLDSDKGRKFRGTLKRIGEETLEAAGAQRACMHYRITGDVQVDLWYDASRRLVRQEAVESGHKIRLELTRLAAE